MQKKLKALWEHINGIRIDMNLDERHDWERQEAALCEAEEIVYNLLYLKGQKNGKRN